MNNHLQVAGSTPMGSQVYSINVLLQTGDPGGVIPLAESKELGTEIQNEELGRQSDEQKFKSILNDKFEKEVVAFLNSKTGGDFRPD